MDINSSVSGFLWVGIVDTWCQVGRKDEGRRTKDAEYLFVCAVTEFVDGVEWKWLRAELAEGQCCLGVC